MQLMIFLRLLICVLLIYSAFSLVMLHAVDFSMHNKRRNVLSVTKKLEKNESEYANNRMTGGTYACQTRSHQNESRRNEG